MKLYNAKKQHQNWRNSEILKKKLEFKIFIISEIKTKNKEIQV